MGLFGLIAIVVALSTVGSIVKAILTHRARSTSAADLEAFFRRVEDGMLELKDQVSAVREEMAELQERVDFTERMLAKSRSEAPRIGG